MLRLWVPALLVLGMIGFVLANADAAGVGAGTPSCSSSSRSSCSSGRCTPSRSCPASPSARATPPAWPPTIWAACPGVARDRLAARRGGGIVWFGTDAVLAILGGLWVWCWSRNERRMLDDVRARFTTEPAR
ncbi:hypothetical protein NKG05_07025 [Oerskovia sp. M15]